jgi:hypothetical protein
MDVDPRSQPSLSTSDLVDDTTAESYPPSPTSVSNASFKSDVPSTKSFGSFASFGQNSRRDTASSGKSSASETKRLSLAAVTNAAANAKKWGWNAIQRHAERSDSLGDGPENPSRPLVMGRGQPLPPPGTPLPPPDRKTKTAPIPVPKRKPIPAPAMPVKHKHNNESSGDNVQRHAVPPPLLPKRRSREDDTSESVDGIFVVAAPHGDSEPSTPMSENHPTYVQPCIEEMEDSEEIQELHKQSPARNNPEPPQLPKRRPPHRVLSSSPEEDGPGLPSWMAAQEEEARAKSTFVDEDMGV